MISKAIQADSISKRYQLGSGFPTLRGMFASKSKRYDRESERYHWAVRDVSFELRPGDALGIIGPNGAGKTTILKILSRVTRPTNGELRMNGRLSALIELGAGFHPDLSGRENIFLNGTILGLKRAEIKTRFDDIVEFAGVGQYLDTPVKRYSSGMYARLGFAIAAHVDPEIMLVDEVLAVGDYAFQMKCYARMAELRKKGVCLIFVSHDLEAVRRVCERGLVMYRGRAIFQGTAGESVVAYSDAIRKAARDTQHSIPSEEGLSQRVMTFEAEIVDVKLLDEDGQNVTMMRSGATVTAAIEVCFHKAVSQPIFSLAVRTPDGRLIYDTTTRWMNFKTPEFSAGDRCRTTFRLELPLLEGEYQLGVDVARSDFSHYYDRLERALGFWVKAGDRAKGLVDLGAEVNIEKVALIGGPVAVS